MEIDISILLEYQKQKMNYADQKNYIQFHKKTSKTTFTNFIQNGQISYK